MTNPTLIRPVGREPTTLVAAGSWIAVHSSALERLVDSTPVEPAAAQYIAIDVAGVEQLDTLGAWVLERLVRTQ